mmetsp:Transcript_15799/g.45620  ORF Transcript_15799/g.45620 Transcript_15799/m.45620 type:complete len:394 (+) Transcript_15799:187-1368(+)
MLSSARSSMLIPSLRRYLSSAAAVELPTRHSIMQPPRVCTDPVELAEQTQKLLETKVGKLYAERVAFDTGREEAYDLAFKSIKMAEYLQLGHAATVPGSLYADDSAKLTDDPIESSMKPLIARMQREGELLLALRKEKRLDRSRDSFSPAGSSTSSDGVSDLEGYLASSDDDGSSSSDDESSSDSSDEEDEPNVDSFSGSDPPSESVTEFAPPGPTTKMQEALLDAMACIGTAGPDDYYQRVLEILEANDIDKGSNPYTLPTHVTYNAALRGIAKCDMSHEAIRDDALSASFSIYNHLTHSLHLPRNSMTYVYMLQVLDKAFPPSRVKGNISVTFWDHAVRQGVVTDAVVDAVKQIHASSNGPEFEAILDEVSGPLPQKHRRFVNKYRHSENY